jgi:hypothetical protein
MRSIFTVHAGEYLVGSYIEKKFKEYNVWVPAKDTGVDLLVTNSKNIKVVSFQVKFSKDYVVTHMKPVFPNRFKAWGWWTLNGDKIKKSNADLWVFAMQSFQQKTIECIVIPPRVLLQKLRKIHGSGRIIQSYLWVTTNGRCWETRDLSQSEKISVANDSYSNENRNFSAYLNNWRPLTKKLK